MKSISEPRTKEEIEVAHVVHGFVNAVCAFQKLSPEQKELFFENVVLQKHLSDVLNDDHFHIPRIYLRSNKPDC